MRRCSRPQTVWPAGSTGSRGGAEGDCPLGNPSPEPLRIQNPVKHLDHAKREVVAARYYDILAEVIEAAAEQTTKE